MIAQNTTAEIAKSLGFNELAIYFYDINVDNSRELSCRIDGILSGVANGDIVFFQSPTWNDMRYDEAFIAKLQAYRDIKIGIFVNDVLPLMFESNEYLLKRVVTLYNQASLLIVPSDRMLRFLQKNGLTVRKTVIQQCWDYPTAAHLEIPMAKPYLNFIGNPEKFEFVRNWQYEFPLHLFTAPTEIVKGNVTFEGWQYTTNLISKLSKGGWGLVWAQGHVKKYMEMCVSYKLSTYLAAGIPVIVEEDLSNQEIIRKNDLGLVVESLEQAINILKHMTPADYQAKAANVKRFSFLLREGYFTKKFLLDAVHKILQNS